MEPEVTRLIRENRRLNSEQLRIILKNGCGSQEEYLKKLETIVTIQPARAVEYGRMAGLTKRAGFCTNGVSMSVKEFQRYPEKRVHYAVRTSDVFGDLGLVGGMGLYCGEEMDTLELFYLSDWVLNRGIEGKMLQFLKKKFDIKKAVLTNNGKNQEIIMKIYCAFDIKKCMESYI